MKILSNIDLKTNSIQNLQNINDKVYEYSIIPKIYRYYVNLFKMGSTGNACTYDGKFTITHNLNTLSYYIIRTALFKSSNPSNILLIDRYRNETGNEAHEKVIYKCECSLNEINMSLGSEYKTYKSDPYDKAYVDIIVFPEDIVTELTIDAKSYL